MTATVPTPATRLRTVEEAREQLGVAKTKVYELMSSGELAFVKLPPGSNNAGRRIEQAEIDAFIARNRTRAS
jgi:excisionase family DNA binding protein